MEKNKTKEYLGLIEGVLDNIEEKFEYGLNDDELRAVEAGLGDSYCDDLNSYYMRYMFEVCALISKNLDKMCQTQDCTFEGLKNYIHLIKKVIKIREKYIESYEDIILDAKLSLEDMEDELSFDNLETESSFEDKVNLSEMIRNLYS